jgi:acetyl-CoA acetyltransferase
VRGATAIAGVGESSSWDVSGTGLTPLDLISEATAAALEDSGLAKDDIDGLFTASAYYGMPGLNVGEHLGIRPRYSDSTNLGGASFLSHVLPRGHGDPRRPVRRRADRLRLDAARRRRAAEVGRRGLSGRERLPPALPGDPVRAGRRRHMHEFGTTREQLAEVAVAARAWAQPNDRAFARDPLASTTSSPRGCSPRR